MDKPKRNKRLTHQDIAKLSQWMQKVLSAKEEYTIPDVWRQSRAAGFEVMERVIKETMDALGFKRRRVAREPGYDRFRAIEKRIDRINLEMEKRMRALEYTMEEINKQMEGVLGQVIYISTIAKPMLKEFENRHTNITTKNKEQYE